MNQQFVEERHLSGDLLLNSPCGSKQSSNPHNFISHIQKYVSENVPKTPATFCSCKLALLVLIYRIYEQLKTRNIQCEVPVLHLLLSHQVTRPVQNEEPDKLGSS